MRGVARGIGEDTRDWILWLPQRTEDASRDLAFRASVCNVLEVPWCIGNSLRPSRTACFIPLIKPAPTLLPSGLPSCPH